METSSVMHFKNRVYELPAQLEKPILLAWKLNSPGNYGNLIRLAASIGCRKLYFVKGETVPSERKIRKTAGDNYNKTDHELIDEESIFDMIPKDYTWVALETVSGSENIYESKLPANMVLVVGNEKHGIEASALARCEMLVHIPLTGSCTSLNVSHAAAIGLFEWLRQRMQF
ncbi:TrmH family RNA methyltransferase [Roseimarinus sediminis]|uniref:TrmH family RNA methyltransferase n=1 Tax=Roseimarinus sediminis TaxID=1610899 RepID=UPI003D1B5299